MRRGEVRVEPGGPVHRRVAFLVPSLDAADKAFGIPGLRQVRVNRVRLCERYASLLDEVRTGAYFFPTRLVPSVFVVTDVASRQLAPGEDRPWVEPHRLLQDRACSKA